MQGRASEFFAGVDFGSDISAAAWERTISREIGTRIAASSVGHSSSLLHSPKRSPPMKRIEALIPHDLIQDVEQSLSSLGVRGLTLTSVYSQSLSPGPLASSRTDRRFRKSVLQIGRAGVRCGSSQSPCGPAAHRRLAIADADFRDGFGSHHSHPHRRMRGSRTELMIARRFMNGFSTGRIFRFCWIGGAGLADFCLRGLGSRCPSGTFSQGTSAGSRTRTTPKFFLRLGAFHGLSCWGFPGAVFGLFYFANSANHLTLCRVRYYS